MTNLLHKIEKQQIDKLVSNKRIPAFRSGDTLKVTVKIVESERSRLQAFEGLCIARKNNGISSKFTVRKLSHGEGVEKVFPLFSPMIDKIEVIRKGSVKRSKLYYLRDRMGKKARISDHDRGDEADQYDLVESKNIINENNNVEKNTEETTKGAVDSTEVKEGAVVQEEKPIDKKSESTAIEADKTEDESKS